MIGKPLVFDPQIVHNIPEFLKQPHLLGILDAINNHNSHPIGMHHEIVAYIVCELVKGRQLM